MNTQPENTKQLQQKSAPPIYSAHLPGSFEIPQPRQGRHIPTPPAAQRNPGIQTPQQNKSLKGVTLVFSSVYLFSCSPELVRGDTSSTAHLFHPAGTRNSTILFFLLGFLERILSTPEILSQIKIPPTPCTYALCPMPSALNSPQNKAISTQFQPACQRR